MHGDIGLAIAYVAMSGTTGLDFLQKGMATSGYPHNLAHGSDDIIDGGRVRPIGIGELRDVIGGAPTA